MRTAFLLIIAAVIAVPACQPMDEGPSQLSGLSEPEVSLLTRLVRTDLVRLVWSVTNPAGRRFEFQRQNRSEPWKHFATVDPVDGLLKLEDTGVVPGQRYTYRLRILGTKGDNFLDEIEVEIPLN